MKKIFLVSIIFIILMSLSIYTEPNQDMKSSNNANLFQPLSKMSVNLNYGNLPLYFIPNKGQVHKDAVFYAKTQKYTLWITRDSLIFDTIKRDSRHKKDVHQADQFIRDVSRLIFIDANKEPVIVPLDMSQHRVNYFIGKDKSKWKTNIPTAKAVMYKKMYKDIDLKVYGIEKQIEYDWIVKPGGNPGDIQFKYNDITSSYIDDKGDLIIETKFGQLIHKKPLSYQVIAGKTVPVKTRYKKIGKHAYGFHVMAYNKNYELIIDPVVLGYSTIVDGDTDTDGTGIALDASGRAYVTGYTDNTSFPTQGPFDPGLDGAKDVFVFRLSAAGDSLEYSTYLGSSGTDEGHAIAVDSSNCAYVTGVTDGTDFPTVNAYRATSQLGSDAFVTRFSAAGDSLIYSTYLGSNDNDWGRSIAVDSSGYAYVTGRTDGSNFPTTPNAYAAPNPSNHEAFLTKFSPSGTTLSYSTTIGYGMDFEIYGLAADNSGNAYVVGYTASSTFTLKNQYSGFSGLKDIIAFKIDTTQIGEDSLIYSTYIGGSSDEEGYAIAIDSSGSAYITGSTSSSDFPVLNAYQGAINGSRDAFVLKLSPSGNTLGYSTYLGGSQSENDDRKGGIAVDSSGNAYVTGSTTSADFPMVEEYDNTLGTEDIFVTKLSTGGSNLRYSTFYGGSSKDVGYAIAVDGSGSAYVTGNSSSTDFDGTPPTGVVITDPLGVYVLKLDFTVSDEPPTVTITTPNTGDTVGGVVTIEATAADDNGINNVEFFIDNTSIGTVASAPYSFDWDSSTVNNGEHTIRAVATDSINQTESHAIIVTVDNGITVIFPNGGETLEGNTSADITWTSSGVAGNVKIELSADDGVTWTEEIAASTNNDGSYTWTVPNYDLDTYQIRISSELNPDIFDTSDASFTIVPEGTQTITVSSPNGGEILTGGDPYTITWQSTGGVGNVALAYSIDNGSNWTNITTTGNTGSYTWTLPVFATTQTQCLVRVRDAADNDPSDQSDNVFTISAFSGDSITVVTPNGGELFWIGTIQEITWTSTGSVGNVRIQYSINNGSSWINIAASTANDGSYFWTVPDNPSSQCLVRIREAADGIPGDVSNAVFTIGEQGATLSLTSPTDGDTWQVGSKHDITWISGEKTGNYVKLLYSTNNQVSWKTITSSTANDGSYTWTIPNTPSTTCNVKIIDTSDTSVSNISFGTFAIISGKVEPEISLNRTHLYYGAMKSSSAKTPTQTITVNNTGYGTLKWMAAIYDEDPDDSDDLAWIQLSNTAGTESGTVKVDINPLGLAVGTYTGAIKFTSTDASNSPQIVYMTLKVYASQADADPFGSFDSPIDGSTVMSSIPVTGWALDDIGIDKVTIWRNAVTGEGGGEVYIGDAIQVEGPRPDVEQAFPTYPMSYKGGWGYMLLTNMLPNGGNGPFTLHAYAQDLVGRKVKLGSKTITCDNAHAVKPFGAIDTPVPGSEANGTNFRNQGWVLTPMPNKIPTDGSTINVYVDAQNLGNTHYNIFRLDIATLFPGYANSSGALGYLDFDTTAFESGLHTIQWVATDNAGNRDGIGSRYFYIQNPGYNGQSTSKTVTTSTNNPGKSRYRFSDLLKIPWESSASIRMTTGYKEAGKPRTIPAGKDGIIHVSVPQDERIVLDLSQPYGLFYTGYLKVNQLLRPLPPGASMDSKNGVLYWQPGPASFGKYQLVFITTDKNGLISKKEVTIEITSKFAGQ